MFKSKLMCDQIRKKSQANTNRQLFKERSREFGKEVSKNPKSRKINSRRGSLPNGQDKENSRNADNQGNGNQGDQIKLLKKKLNSMMDESIEAQAIFNENLTLKERLLELEKKMIQLKKENLNLKSTNRQQEETIKELRDELEDEKLGKIELKKSDQKINFSYQNLQKHLSFESLDNSSSFNNNNSNLNITTDQKKIDNSQINKQLTATFGVCTSPFEFENRVTPTTKCSKLAKKVAMREIRREIKNKIFQKKLQKKRNRESIRSQLNSSNSSSLQNIQTLQTQQSNAQKIKDMMESKKNLLALKKKRFENQQFQSFCSRISSRSPNTSKPSYIDQNNRRSSVVGEGIRSKMSKMNKKMSETSFNRNTSFGTSRGEERMEGMFGRHNSNNLFKRCHLRTTREAYFAKNEY